MRIQSSLAAALVVSVLLTFTAGAQNRGPLELANATVPPGALRIAYGSDTLQFGELRLPSGKGPHPVAIVIHGGCWLAQLGNLDKRAVAIDNMRPLAAALTEAGVATWNIEYRRLGDTGGGWPGSFRDVANGADFLRTLAREHPLDLKRTVSIGHSAGAHFAIWLASRPKLPKSSDLYISDPLPLTGVISLDGPADLKATIPLQRPICNAPVITDLIGGSPEERPVRYREGSPIELLPFGIPQVFFAGQMFGSHLEPYAAAVKKAGDPLQAVPFPKAGHFVFIDPQSDVWPQVRGSVLRLLSMSSTK